MENDDTAPDRAPDTEIVEQEVWIPSASGRLEAVVSYPPDGTSGRGILLINPHPSYGGDMSNNVVRFLSSALPGAGHATLRFNFHAIGRSESHLGGDLDGLRYWERILETDSLDAAASDVRAAHEWLADFAGETHLVGYSYGAALALLLAAEDPRAQSVVAIGLASGRNPLGFLADVRVPVLALHSDRDFATPLEVLEERLSRLGGSSDLVVLRDTDHFFRGREPELLERTVSFIGGIPARRRSDPRCPHERDSRAH